MRRRRQEFDKFLLFFTFDSFGLLLGPIYNEHTRNKKLTWCWRQKSKITLKTCVVSNFRYKFSHRSIYCSFFSFQDRLMLSVRLTYVKTCLGANWQCFQTASSFSPPPCVPLILTNFNKTLSYLTQQNRVKDSNKKLTFVEKEEAKWRRSKIGVTESSRRGHVSSHFSFKLKLLKWINVHTILFLCVSLRKPSELTSKQSDKSDNDWARYV